MTSTLISRASAAVLALGGLTLLFAPDVVLPRLVPAFPAEGAWLGQLLAASWLALAALNWFSRSMVLGGIYGRPIVLANAAHWFISATALLKIVARGDAPAVLALLVVPAALLAGVYGWLLFRGPLARDLDAHRRAQRGAA